MVDMENCVTEEAVAKPSKFTLNFLFFLLKINFLLIHYWYIFIYWN